MPDSDAQSEASVSDREEDEAEYALSDAEETGGAQAVSASAGDVQRQQTTALTNLYTLPEVPETIKLRPTAKSGPSLHYKLWFNSDEWVSALRHDVQDLIKAVTTQWSESSVMYNFESFKRAWIALGWSKLLVLGFVEGPMRQHWCQSVLRAFTEHLSKDKPFEEQVVCLFALYALWFSQTKTMNRIHIPVDPGLLEHIVELPSIVSDVAKSSTGLSTKALSKRKAVDDFHLDVAYVVTSLFDASAFFVLPRQTMFQPRKWPNAFVRTTTIADIPLAAQTLLAIEAEVAELERGRLRLEEWNNLRDRKMIDLLREPAGSVISKIAESVPAVHSDKVTTTLKTDTQRNETSATWDDDKGWRASIEDRMEQYILERDKLIGQLIETDMGQLGASQGDESNKVGDYVLNRAHDLTKTAVRTALIDLFGDDDKDVASLFETDEERIAKRPKLDLINLVEKDSSAMQAYRKAVQCMVDPALEDGQT
ncbi:hypothetical protein OIV83_001166 [Microbotryomycetes sp. JL201]|nr:hypothetical protein OIV83_001166 [Microbotryomycetes sp. JL201]